MSSGCRYEDFDETCGGDGIFSICIEYDVRKWTMVKVSIIYLKNAYKFRLKDKRRKQIRFENINYNFH